MTQALFTILSQDFAIECAEHERRRLEDLALALNARLAGMAGQPDATRRLALAALSLLDESQAVNAALVRAHNEIERLSDMLVEAQVEAAKSQPDNAERGRVDCLRRVAQGAA